NPSAGDVGEVPAGGRTRAGTHHSVLEQLDDVLDRNTVLADWVVEQLDPFVFRLDVRFERGELAEKALGRRDHRIAQSLAAAGSGLERTGGPLEPADALDQSGIGAQVAAAAGW